MSIGEPVIRVSNLSKCFQIYDQPRDRLLQGLWRGRRQFYREFWAVREVSFEVRKGESVAIVGRNGSGKSTLLQLIAGTLAPSRGEVEVRGRLAALLELGSGFNLEFTGRDNVFLSAAILGVGADEMHRRFDEIAAFAGIGEFMDRPVKTYSSGMMVRLAFAVSVCLDPEILIVDEALSVGDAGFQFKCLDRLQTLIRRGTTLLFVSHDMSMVKNFCQSALYLQDGRERARGAPEEIAELYALDMRDEQRRSTAPGQRVTGKTFIGSGKGMAFGTEDGDIVDARFAPHGGQSAVYARGDLADFEVQVALRPQVAQPTLSVLLQDQRLVNIGGRHFAIGVDAAVDGAVRSTLRVRFPVQLAPGRYFITLRLESRHSNQVFMPIDKQVGVLSFDVAQGEGDFIGPVIVPFEQL